MWGVRVFALTLAVAMLGATGWAFAQAARTPAESVAFRQEQMRHVGASFKGISDGLRQREPNFDALKGNARALSQLAQDASNWFPADSAPPAGQRNRAKAEIWNDPRFAQLMRQFQTSTQDLAGAEDLATFRTRIRPVMITCASCHNSFTVPD